MGSFLEIRNRGSTNIPEIGNPAGGTYIIESSELDSPAGADRLELELKATINGSISSEFMSGRSIKSVFKVSEKCDLE